MAECASNTLGHLRLCGSERYRRFARRFSQRSRVAMAWFSRPLRPHLLRPCKVLRREFLSERVSPEARHDLLRRERRFRHERRCVRRRDEQRRRGKHDGLQLLFYDILNGRYADVPHRAGGYSLAHVLLAGEVGVLPHPQRVLLAPAIRHGTLAMTAEHQPLEERRFGAWHTLGGTGGRLLEEAAHLVPELPRYKRLLASLDDLPVVAGVADISDVAEAVVDRLHRPRPAGETLDTFPLELRHHLLDRFELQEELEDVRHVLRRGGVGDEVLVLDLVAVGRDAADEVVLVEGGSEVPLDAFLNGLAFPLPEGHNQVHYELAHWGRGIDERFRNRGDPDSELLHLLVELAEVLCASGH